MRTALQGAIVGLHSPLLTKGKRCGGVRWQLDCALSTKTPIQSIKASRRKPTAAASGGDANAWQHVGSLPVLCQGLLCLDVAFFCHLR